MALQFQMLTTGDAVWSARSRRHSSFQVPSVMGTTIKLKQRKQNSSSAGGFSTVLHCCNGGGGGAGGWAGGGGGGGGGGFHGRNSDENGGSGGHDVCLALLGVEASTFWEVKNGKWMRYSLDGKTNSFVLDSVKWSDAEAETTSCEEQQQATGGTAAIRRMKTMCNWCLDVFKETMVPVGYPKSVTGGYTSYSLWRMGQLIASQISGVLTTQALLYAVGLGKGAIPTAAAINWVLKDGIGYLSKIVLSKYGRHFDVNPKGWRLLSDFIENIANGLELMTPSFPHLFVPLSALAGAGKSASGLIQAATRSCFYAGFAAERNFAEIIAKGEAQGMVGKFIGIAIGIGVSGKVGVSGPLLVLTFGAVTSLHILCNLKSYQALQLHTLNPYRTGLVITHYLTSEKVLSIRDVNSEEPIFTAFKSPKLSKYPLEAAAEISQNLQLGVSFGDVAIDGEATDDLLRLYAGEQYILCFQDPFYKVVLKQAATPRDMLRAAVQACYLRHVHKQQQCVGNDSLHKVSYKAMNRDFEQVMNDVASAGWCTDGLLARPASNRIVSL